MKDQIALHPPQRVFGTLLILVALGVATLGVGLFLDPQRTWANLLLASIYLLELSTGSLVLLSLLYVSGARWSVPLQRLPEALAAALPVGGIGLMVVLLVRPSLYAWTTHGAEDAGPASPLRSLWLERPSFCCARWLTSRFG
jgi:hypothetical protein